MDSRKQMLRNEEQSGSSRRKDFHKHDRSKKKGKHFHKDVSFLKKEKTLVIERNGSAFPTFQKPFVRGQFSVNKHRECEANCKQMKYLQFNYNMKVSFDLNKGLKDCIRKNHPPEYLNHIFYWLQKHHYIVNGNIHSQLQGVFVCFRGLLTTIMCTPYEESEGWIICAKKCRSTIFLCAFDTEEKISRQRKETKRQKQMCSWGYKFEQYMLSDRPNVKPNTNEPINENEEWCCLFSSKLSEHRLLYGAEMDGVVSEDVLDVDKDPHCLQKVTFVELKTNRHIETQRHDKNFRRFKMLKWWCQSFLVGIETIICGFRDDSGFVDRIEKYLVKDLPKLAKGLWEPSVCMNFCVQFLDFVKSCLSDTENTNWKFEWHPGEHVSAVNVDTDQSYDFFPECLRSVE